MAIVSISKNHKLTMDDMIAAMTEISETIQNIKKDGAPMPFDNEDLTFLRQAYGLVVNRKQLPSIPEQEKIIRLCGALEFPKLIIAYVKKLREEEGITEFST